MNFQKNLNYFLKNKNMKISDLSKEIQVPVSTLHGWVNGVPPKNFLHLKNLSSFVGCTLDDLFSENFKGHSYTDLNISISLGDDQYKIFLKKVK